MAYPPPPYADAVTGAPLTGEAITGMWWAYPPNAVTVVGGVLPQVEAVSGNIPPTAKLTLGAYTPQVEIVFDTTVVVGVQAGLVLAEEIPGISISTLLAVTEARLALGAAVPDFAGLMLLLPVDCSEVDLGSVSGSSLILEEVPAASVPLEEVVS